jgi:hypothetical protein
MRQAGALTLRRGAGQWAELAGSARAVLAWAVLAGLFLMHGAASPAAGCCGGAPVTAMTATGMPAMPAAATGSTSHPGAVRAPAGPVLAAARHVASASAAAASPTAASPAHSGVGGGMLCSARQPRGALFGPFAIPAVGMAACAVTAMAGPVVVTCRAARPPGKPGLPLPLFLGVSRT